MARLAEIDANRIDRQTRRRQQRQIQTQNFLLSLHMLQANNYLRESGDENTPFEDYSIYMYRQNAPEFTDRVKELEKKLLYPVSNLICCFWLSSVKAFILSYLAQLRYCLVDLLTVNESALSRPFSFSRCLPSALHHTEKYFFFHNQSLKCVESDSFRIHISQTLHMISRGE